MNKNIIQIIAGILFTLLLSCENPKDYYLSNNLKPVVELKSNTGYFAEVSDLHKLSSNDNYSCIFRYRDDQEISNVEINNISGNGTYQVVDSTFYYFPDTTGQHILEIIFYDPYGFSTSCKLNLNVFWNLAPVAVFNYSLNNNLLNVDASGSYDQDEEYGGQISDYLYILDGNEYHLQNNSFTQSIELSEIHIIKLQVTDNDGDKSSVISDIIQPK